MYCQDFRYILFTTLSTNSEQLLHICVSVCVCVRMSYHEKDLLQPLDAVFVPRRADVDAARLTANQMLRQQHNETLNGKTICYMCVKAAINRAPICINISVSQP